MTEERIGDGIVFIGRCHGLEKISYPMPCSFSSLSVYPVPGQDYCVWGKAQVLEKQVVYGCSIQLMLWRIKAQKAQAALEDVEAAAGRAENEVEHVGMLFVIS